MSKDFIRAKTIKGRVFQIMKDGREVDITPPPALPSRPAPDEAGMSLEELRQLKPVPRTKTMRRALSLTQEEFSERYRIPLGTLRDWEQGRSEPDAPSRAYLKVIAKDPEFVARALAS